MTNKRLTVEISASECGTNFCVYINDILIAGKPYEIERFIYRESTTERRLKKALETVA